MLSRYRSFFETENSLLVTTYFSPTFFYKGKLMWADVDYELVESIPSIRITYNDK